MTEKKTWDQIVKELNDPYSWPERDSNDPNPVMGNCPKCGLELRRMMMYSCNQPNCPCFIQATC